MVRYQIFDLGKTIGELGEETMRKGWEIVTYTPDFVLLQKGDEYEM